MQKVKVERRVTIPMKRLMLGNKAFARGLYEAGCSVVSSYPGTPSTEVTEEIAKYDVIEDGNFKTIHITLKYGADKNEKIITGLKRISKPGLRVYAGKEDMPKVLGGLGVAIVSTNQGVVTDKKARELGVGGEVLAFVW